LIAAPGQSGDFCFVRPDSDQFDSLGEAGVFKRAVAFSTDPLGYIYVVDEGTHEIIKLSLKEKKTVRTGGFGWSGEGMDKPSDIITPNGLDVYVSDYGNHRILRFDRNLNIVSTLPPENQEELSGRLFGYPRSVDLSRFGDLLISDGENGRIVKYNGSGEFERSFGGIDAGKGRLLMPKRVRISNRDRVYVQDVGRIVIFDIFGNYLQTISEGLSEKFQTFTLYRDTLYALDSSGVCLYDQAGKLLGRYEVIPAARDAVDIGVGNGIFLALTERNIYTFRFDKYLPKK